MNDIEELKRELEILKFNQSVLIRYLNDDRLNIHKRTNKIHISSNVVIEK